MDWITAHLAEIGVVVLLVVKIAEIVVRWTATTKDDAIVAKIKGVVGNVWPS